MKRVLLQFFIVPAIILGIGSCSDKGGGGGGGGGTTEANLAVTLNPPAGSTQPAAPQVDFPLTVSITSTMPPQGVTIDVKAAPDGSATNFFTETRSSTTANNNFTITGTPTGVVCVTTVTVTSKSKPANTWTGSYRYTRKP
ncbi:MAG TPA: hypothetical protein VHQ93_02080 [Chitinophagaceae bacterium]|nr:hypothetical protein [Chitinophagaceae bacterium]